MALVPTMGALHAGHASLLRLARRTTGVVVASVFVNPLQFAPGEDLDRYPRSLDADLATCAREGTDVVFVPAVDEVYPEGLDGGVTVDPGPLGPCSRARCDPPTSAACSRWWPSCSAWCGRTRRGSARRTTSSWC